MSKSLLAHIASSFISQYENVANSGVCYLLNEYAAARDALQSVLRSDTVPDKGHYQTEQSTKYRGRPDITGTDGDDKKVVIIEGKFWANLTENQPNGYINELDNDGRLLFLVPEKRKKSLQLELTKRLGGEDERVLVWSWNQFLSLIEKENNKEYDAGLSSDLIQLKTLCQRMDVEGMPPLSKFDLDPMNGRITAQLADVINECQGVLRKWKHANFSGLQKTSKQYGHGFYFRGHNFGCYLQFSSHEWYTRDNHTPIWLSIQSTYDSETKKWHNVPKKINPVLRKFDPDNVYDEHLGIILEAGMDKDQVVQHIVDRVKEALEYLNDNVIK